MFRYDLLCLYLTYSHWLCWSGNITLLPENPMKTESGEKSQSFGQTMSVSDIQQDAQTMVPPFSWPCPVVPSRLHSCSDNGGDRCVCRPSMSCCSHPSLWLDSPSQSQEAIGGILAFSWCAEWPRHWNLPGGLFSELSRVLLQYTMQAPVAWTGHLNSRTHIICPRTGILFGWWVSASYKVVVQIKMNTCQGSSSWFSVINLSEMGNNWSFGFKCENQLQSC